MWPILMASRWRFPNNVRCGRMRESFRIIDNWAQIGVHGMENHHMLDYLKYYSLENYLFEDVHNRFHSQGWLDAFDFFSIVIWKANRAKSLTALRLMKIATEKTDLEAIVRSLTASVFKASEHR